MQISVRGKYMEVAFTCSATRTSYCICDLSGKELKAGALEKTDNHQFDISGIASGIYYLCIIDGDELHKSKFQIT